MTEGCAEFLENQLLPTNCLSLKRFAEIHGCTSLKNFAQEYIFEYFDSIVSNEEFLQLSFEEVEELVRLEEIVVSELCLTSVKKKKIRIVHIKRFKVKRLSTMLFSTGFIMTRHGGRNTCTIYSSTYDFQCCHRNF